MGKLSDDDTTKRVGDARLDSFYRQLGTRAGLKQRLASIGLSGVTEFVESNPAVTYPALARRVPGGPVIPMTLIQEHAIEAVLADRVRDLAMEMFVRFIREELPNGWTHCAGSELDFGTAGPLASTMCAMQGARVLETDYKLSERAFRSLVGLSPPVGWLPSGVDDPLIEAAFTSAWPIGEKAR